MPAAPKLLNTHLPVQLAAGSAAQPAASAGFPEPEASGAVVRTATQPDPRAESEFARFFEVEWPRLKRYLKRHVRAEDAEDVAQEAFARLFVHESNARSPSGFLYQTARNLVKDDKRRARRVQAVLVESAPMETIADPRPSPEEEAEWRQRLAQTSALFDRMSPKCRQVFLLRVTEGCTYAEIAARFGMTPLAVEKQLLRAFEICAKWGGDDGTAPRKRDRLS